MTEPTELRPTLPLRLALAAVIAFATVGTLVALLVATDTALSIGQRLERLPMPLAIVVAAAFAGLLGTAAWAIRRLLRKPPAKLPSPPPVTRDAVDARLDRLAARTDDGGARDLGRMREELAALDRRAAGGELHVALFGEVSTGKTSLMRALTGRDDLAVDVRGGTTRDVRHVRGALPDGRAVVLSDLPGLGEAGDAPGLHNAPNRAALARAEALRAHALVFVADAEPTRSQHAALEAMLTLAKPTVIALNKVDRYDSAERHAIVTRLRARYGDRALIVTARAGGAEERVRRHADGREERELTPRATEIAALVHALETLTAPGVEALEPGRQRAVLEAIARRIDAEEAALRARDAAGLVQRYTRRAVVGALAAVAPGTDLVIQSALATAMLRELAALYEVSIRRLDLDAFVQRAAGTVRATTSITLAIAGNVLKAFPGFGTVGGGVLHAVAYGLIFDALGRAVAQTLAERPALDAAAEARFAELLAESEPTRLASIAKLARDALTETTSDDALSVLGGSKPARVDRPSR